MLLECLIRREGPTEVVLEKTKYNFMPIPGSKKGEMTTSVCDVANDAHAQRLLATGQYREFNQEKAEKEAIDRRKKQKPMYEGCSIEKYMDIGYIAVKKTAEGIRYAGADETWRAERSGTHFKTEIEAFNFIKEDVEASSKIDDDLGKTLSELTGKGKKKTEG